MGLRASRFVPSASSEKNRYGVPIGMDPRIVALSKVHGVPMRREWMSLYPPHKYTREKALEDLQHHRLTGQAKHFVPKYHTILAKGDGTRGDPREYALRKIHGMSNHEIKNVLKNDSYSAIYTHTQALQDLSRHLQGKEPRHRISRGIQIHNSKTGVVYKQGSPAENHWGYSHDLMYGIGQHSHSKHRHHHGTHHHLEEEENMLSRFNDCINTNSTHSESCQWAKDDRLFDAENRFKKTRDFSALVDPRFKCAWKDRPTTSECSKLIQTYERERKNHQHAAGKNHQHAGNHYQQLHMMTGIPAVAHGVGVAVGSPVYWATPHTAGKKNHHTSHSEIPMYTANLYTPNHHAAGKNHQHHAAAGKNHQHHAAAGKNHHHHAAAGKNHQQHHHAAAGKNHNVTPSAPERFPARTRKQIQENLLKEALQHNNFYNHVEQFVTKKRRLPV
jgi:hypothetical protein